MTEGAESEMANDPTTTKEQKKPKEREEPDPELARLEKETARLLARRKLAEARLGALESLSPGATDLPKNEVTLGAKAGALGPWLAQDVLAGLAGTVATDVGTALESVPSAVVFVTADAHLLAGDVSSRQVGEALDGRVVELSLLVRRLASAREALGEAVAEYEQEEREEQEEQQPRLLDEAASPRTAGEAGDKATTPAPTATGTAAGAGPFGVAIDLVRLLATDYTVTAAEVSVDSALLARLTAGRLPGKGRQVLLDGVALAGDSPTLASYQELVGGVAAVVDAAQQLADRVAPVVAEAEVHQAAVEKLHEAWTTTLADQEADPGAAAEIKKSLDLRTQRLTVRRSAAAPAQRLLEHAEEVVAAVRAEVAALAEPDATGVTPLQRACSRDRLHVESGDKVTHVLLVSATHAGADVITRRSVLGVSGRLAYLGGATSSWVLVDADGRVTGGGASAEARQMTHDIATGEARKNTVTTRTGSWTSKDPLARNENLIRIGVLLLALGIALVGVAATLSVFLPD